MSDQANYRVAVNGGVPIDTYGARRRDHDFSRWAAERYALVEAVRQSSARRIGGSRGRHE